MAINPKKHVVPHKHIIGDIVDGVTSNFTGGLIGGGGTGGGGWSGGTLNVAASHEPVGRIELIDYTWEWVNGRWTPHLKDMPMGSNHIILSDSDRGHKTDLFLLLVDTYPNLPVDDFDRYGPILGVSTGMMVKKDISCGGFVASNQGIIALGSCLQDSFDSPGAWLTHSECKKINFRGATYPPNPRIGWRVIRTDELVDMSGKFPQYRIHEYQSSGWVKLSISWGGESIPWGSSFDNGYAFGVSRPSWGAGDGRQYFITVGGSAHGHIHYWSGSSWTDLGDIDDPRFAGYFDTFEIKRARYQVPVRTEDYAHLRCANITAHNTNPAADDTYGLGTPDRRWKGLCVNTLYADQIKDPQGNDFEFPAEWDGGTVTKNITIQRADPQLHLDAVSGNPTIIFYDTSTAKMHLGYSAANDRLYINDVLASQTILTLSHNGDLGVQGDLYTAGKLVLRSAVPIIDFAPSGLPAGQEYLVRLEGVTQNNAGWLNIYGHLKIGGDTRIEHGGEVNLNINTLTAGSNVAFNLQYLGNTEFMIGANAMNTSSGYIYFGSNNRPIIVSPGSSYIALRGPVYFGPIGNNTAGTAGQVLTSNGAGNAPTWQNAGSGPGGGWNGGTVTGDNITVERVESQLRLNATSGNPALVFYRNGTQRLGFTYVAAAAVGDSYLSLWDYYNNRQIAFLSHDGQFGVLGDLEVGNRLLVSGSYGSAGQVLTSNGSSKPTWQTPGSGPGGWNGGIVTNNITVKYVNASGNVPSVSVQSENNQGCTFNLQIGSATPGNVVGSFGYDSANNRCVLNSSGRALRLTAATGGIWLEHDAIFNGSINIRASNNQPYLNWSNASGNILGTISYPGSTFQIDSRGSDSMSLVSRSGTHIYLAPGGINGTSPGHVELRFGRSIRPESNNQGRIGEQSRYFYEVCTNYIYLKNPGNIQGCERAKSGMEWPHQYSDYDRSMDDLVHEMTKTKYHTLYDPANPDNILCTCGRSDMHPCPEHKPEWHERYTLDLSKIIYPSAYAVLEHAVEMARLTQHNTDLEERNSQLEARVGSLEHKLERLIQLATTPAD